MALEKALITNTETDDKIYVLFNPEEYTLNKDINFAQSAIPGLTGPILQFVSGNMATLEMELLVDTFEAHHEGRVTTKAGQDVRELTNRIVGLMDINPETHAPPVLTFTWATLTFTCVLARCSQKFILFKPDGTPLRARLTVSFNEYLDPEHEMRRVNPQTADYTKQHVVLQGENLTQIAYRYYQNPQLWRPIAIANQLADPRLITAGQRLLIPSLPYTDPQSGERFGA